MKTRIAFFLLVALSFCPSVDCANPLDVSLVQLIAHPKDYHDKVIRVVGFVRLAFEDNAIYLHQDDYTHGIALNGLWLDITDEIYMKKSEFDQKYVLLAGTFHAKEKGHMGLWNGSIQKISRFQVWSQ